MTAAHMAPELRPMTLDDVEPVLELADAAFGDLGRRLGQPPDPPRDRATSLVRFRQPAVTDPGGAWIAHEGEALVGAVQAIDREGVWGLSLLVVHPRAQLRGVGRALLERALAHADGGRRGGIILASEDPLALRRYARAGFWLEPCVQAAGQVLARPQWPAGIRAGDSGDTGDVDAIGRAVRGAGHGPDIPAMFAGGFVLRVAPGEGFVFHRGGQVGLLAARSPDVAADLLRAVLNEVGDAAIGWITARQEWAVPVVLDAGLPLRFGGAVFRRGDTGPFRPYLPSGAYL
jgi:GNAT superfamily N-acetyltransferase